MGLWSRFSPTVLEESEKKLMEYSGVEYEQARVEINQGNYLYCLRCGDPSNPPMILLHCYCGAGLFFYKILKQLSAEYNIFLPDHIGMGRSSRPSFTALSTYEAETFFVEALESFRRIMNLDKFVLAGHSFGGYVSGCYALRYSQHVTKLLLLSPAGVTERPSQAAHIESTWKFSWINKFLHFFWAQNVSLIEILRKTGPLTGVLLKSYMKYNVPENERPALKNFLEQVNLLPGSGEHGISYILDFQLWPYSPLCRRLPELSIPIAFFYGDSDWIVNDGGYSTQTLSRSTVMVYIIKNAGHHMYWDNHDELLEKMLEALHLMDNSTD